MKKEEVVLSDKIRKLKAEKDTIDKIINELTQELKKICTHSLTVKKELNYEGGYLNTAEYNNITECKICGKELKRETIHGGYA